MSNQIFEGTKWTIARMPEPWFGVESSGGNGD